MIKFDEQTKSQSCLNKARTDEMIFVLRAHDVTAPETIRFWVNQRIISGKNNENDEQITEALKCAKVMESQRLEGF